MNFKIYRARHNSEWISEIFFKKNHLKASLFQKYRRKEYVPKGVEIIEIECSSFVKLEEYTGNGSLLTEEQWNVKDIIK